MSEPRNQNDFERSLTAALESEPNVAIPADFAARLAKRASALPLVPARRAVSYGRAAAMVCAAVVLLAVFVLATQAQPSFHSIAFDVQLLLLVQLLGIGWWLIPPREAAD